MSTTKDTLTQVLVDVIANRKNLADQIATQHQQVEVGEAQLTKFDQLISTLQIIVSDDGHLSAVDKQTALNKAAAESAVSPISPAAANEAVAAGVIT